MAEVGSIEASIGEAGSEPVRYRLRFRSGPRSRKSGPTPGYLYLDAALDTLGAERFPKSWGIGEEWRQMPFRPSGGVFRRYRWIDRGSNPKLRQKTVKDVSPDIAKAAALHFRAARGELADLIMSGTVKIAKMNSEGRVAIIEKDELSLFSRKYVQIFYTGEYRVNEAHPRLYQIIIDRSSIQNFLDKKSIHLNSRSLLTNLVNIISGFCDDFEVRISRVALQQFVNSVFLDNNRKAISENQFNKIIWKSERIERFKISGRKSFEEEERFRRNELELRKRLVESISSNEPSGKRSRPA